MPKCGFLLISRRIAKINSYAKIGAFRAVQFVSMSKRLFPTEPKSLSYPGVLEQQASDKGNMFVFPIP